MIAQAIRTLAKTTDETYSVVAKVTAVNEAARTCDAEPLNGDAALLDVRLQAEQGTVEGLAVFPKTGSWVIVTFSGPNDGYVAATSEVEKVVVKIEGQEVEFSASGLKMNSASAALAEQVGKLLHTLDAMTDTLMQFQLATNVGPTVSVMPHVVTKLAQQKADLSAVKQALSTMLY